MKIGIPTEIKPLENRVGMTPVGVSTLTQEGHQVIVQSGAGKGSGFTDSEYSEAGAKIVPTAKEAWDADMVIKVKEPLEPEFGYFKENLILFTYLHLAPEVPLTKALLAKKVTAIAYETVELANGALPLLAPMSEVAGRMSVPIGAWCLQKINGGKGMLLGGVPGVAPAVVTIIGGGVVGLNAARMAIGLGADVTLMDISKARLMEIDNLFQGRIKTLISNAGNIKEQVKKTDLLIGAVLIPGAKAPILVTNEMVKSMQPGSAIVDVAIDQGGCVESHGGKVSYHDNPIFEKFGVVHYTVANMPGAVPRTSTFALTAVTLPYAVRIAKLGAKAAVAADPALKKGMNTYQGHCTYEAVAAAQGIPYTPYDKI